MRVVHKFQKVSWLLSRDKARENDDGNMIYQDTRRTVYWRCLFNRVCLKINSPKLGRTYVFFQAREFSDLAYFALMAKVQSALSSLSSLVVSNVYVMEIILDFLWEGVEEFLEESPCAFDTLQEIARDWKTWQMNTTLGGCDLTVQAFSTSCRLLDLVEEDKKEKLKFKLVKICDV